MPTQLLAQAQAMSTSAAPAVTHPARTAWRLDLTFLGLALGATALLIALVLLDGQLASAGLIALGFGLGVVFLIAEFSFTGALRRFLVRGDAGGVLAALLYIAIAAVAIAPFAILLPNHIGADAPIGPSLIVGAFVFGIGMQLANACGSGTLYTLGGGSNRTIVTLPFFMIGAVIGSFHLPTVLALGGIDPIVAGAIAGPWAGLAITLASIAAAAAVAVAIARRRGGNIRPSRPMLIGAVVIGALSIGVFFVAGHPWSVTFGFTLWGAKVATLAGVDVAAWDFWQWPGPQNALGRSVLADTSSLTDFGMIFGAMAAAAATRPFARAGWPPFPSLLAAAIGGLLMGWGARLGFGCNIGAFVGGVASGSLHGWVWILCALGGCAIGIRLRPLFGLSQE